LTVWTDHAAFTSPIQRINTVPDNPVLALAMQPLPRTISTRW
jgi:hypothetical protein